MIALPANYGELWVSGAGVYMTWEISCLSCTVPNTNTEFVNLHYPNTLKK